MENKASHIFLRPASGLIKAAGALDVFIYNVGLISIGIGIAYTHLLGPANYPGGDIPIASLLATVLMMLIGWALWYWTVCLPRSGGIYVFVTRTFGPAAGFVASFVESMCWLGLNAAAGVLVATVGISPLLSFLGRETGDVRLNQLALSFDKPLAQFLLGALLIVVSGGILILGMRRYFFVQKVMFIIAMAGTAAMVWLLATHSQQHFAARFDQINTAIGPHPYHDVISRAERTGWSPLRFNWQQTVRLLVWPFLPLVGGAFSIAIGGEVRQAKRNQAIGILGSILLCGLLFAWIGQLSYKVFGYEFQGALTFNAGQHNTAYATPTTPYFPLLVYYLTSHLWLAVLIAASFVAWIYFWVPGMLAYAQRSLLAWSFDRLAPECAGYVSDKYHTPVGAIIITTAISLVLLYLYVFTTLFPTLTFILAASSAWLIATLAGCLYPYLRPVLFNTSPVAYHQVLNIPMMTIANALASFALIVVIVLLWNDPVAAGHGMNSLGTVVALYVIGSFLYVVMRRWRLRQGIDIYLAAKEIPIE